MRIATIFVASMFAVCSARAQGTTATLAGVVRDTLGNPLREVQVSIQEINRTTASDSSGAFLLKDVKAGSYEVSIRRIGFIMVQFRWTAKATERVETAIAMRPLPHTLDAVVVYANEGKEMKSKSLVRGTVLDSAGFPVAGAEVQLIGTGRATVTDDNGAFIFRHVRAGEMMVRARLLGYSPAATRLKLGEDDQRDLFLRMGNLAQMLDEVLVREQSGFGRMAEALKDYDQRERFRGSTSSVVLGPERLRELGSTGLDLLARRFPGSFQRGPTEIIAGNATPITHGGKLIEGDACILENGYRPLSRPLRIYAASDLDMVEFYPAPPPEGDPTNTVLWRFTGVPGCDGTPGRHPPYFVVWLKGAK
ncbi:MAG: carboxypeptidase regulatory-like domain-containing protein [Gemmatimonadaceae bacterium]